MKTRSYKRVGALLAEGGVGAVAALLALPVAGVFVLSFWDEGAITFEAYRTVLGSGRQWGLLRNTLAIAGGASAVATVLGSAFALAIEYVRVPTRRWLTYAMLASLLVPPYVYAVVWTDVLSRWGWLAFTPDAAQSLPLKGLALAGMVPVVCVLGTAYFPIVALSALAGLRRYDTAIEDPARLVAGRGRVLRSIVAPLLAPAILGGSVCVFALSLVEFAVPSLLQVDVYSVEIYSRFAATYDAAGAAAQAVPLLVCGTVALLGWLVLAAPRKGRLSGKRSSRDSEECSPARSGPIALAVAAWCVLSACVLLPLGALAVRSLPLTSYGEVWSTAKEELGTSLALSAAAATLVVAVAFGMACLSRAGRPSARLYGLVLAGFVVSGPLLGIGLIVLWNRAGVGPLVYDTPLILVLACAGRFLFFGYLVVHMAQRDLPASLDEAAAVCAVGGGRRTVGILLPMMLPALVVAWGVVFVLSLRELDAGVLVAPPGWTPLPVRLFGLMHYGPSRLVAALCVVTVAAVGVAGLGTGALYAGVRRVWHVGG